MGGEEEVRRASRGEGGGAARRRWGGRKGGRWGRALGGRWALRSALVRRRMNLSTI